MIRHFITIFLLLTGMSSLYAQLTDAMLVGDVQKEGEHIPFATIQVKGTSIGTVTDQTGHYMLNNLPIGKQIIIVRAVGYKTQEQTVELKEGETVELKFYMEEDPVELDNVVITGTRTEQTRTESPIIVNSIQPKVFKATQSVNLAEGLNFVPGIRTECNCENCGFNQVRINGLEGNYTQVLINNRPVFSGLASVYGLEIIPANIIERVETVRGGGSVLYSGNAVAGVVNIITKEPTSNSFTIDANYRMQGLGTGNTSPDFNGSFDVSVVSDDRRVGMSLFGYNRNRSHLDLNDDSFSEITDLENATLGFKTFYRPSSYSKITLDYMNLNEFRRGGNDFELLPHEADIAEQVDHKINNLSLTVEKYFPGKPSNQLTAYASGQTVDRDSYYGAEQDPTAYGFTEDFSHILGVKYTTEHQLITNNVLTMGVENIGNDLKDTKLGVEGEPNSLINDQKINTTGTFVQNEMQFSSTKVLVGVRADRYFIENSANSSADNDDWAFVPRINVLQDISNRTQLRVSYSQGYRAPQVFDEDLHIESSGARTIYHQNAPGLRPETSHSYTASLSHNSSAGMVYFEALAEGFYTDLQDAFINDFGEPDENGDVIYTRYNAESGAVVQGINLELNMTIGPRVTWQNGFTFQSAEYGEEEEEFGEKRFYRTPNQYGYMVVSWRPTQRLSMSMNGKYTGSMLVPHFYEDGASLNETQSFFDAGIQADYSFSLTGEVKLNVYGGLNNIFNSIQDDFDTGINRDPAYVYGPGLPRTLFFGVRFAM